MMGFYISLMPKRTSLGEYMIIRHVIQKKSIQIDFFLIYFDGFLIIQGLKTSKLKCERDGIFLYNLSSQIIYFDMFEL